MPTGNVSFGDSYNGTMVTPIHGSAANTFNFTILFYATNVLVVGPLLHGNHLQDAMTVGGFPGRKNFTSCAVLASVTSTTTATSTKTATATPAVFTGMAARGWMVGWWYLR